VSKFLLDTNVISELRKPKPHGAVIAWLNSLREDQIHVSAVSLGELQRGIERTRKTDSRKAAEIEAWLDQIAISNNVLPMHGAAFREWARLMEGKSDTLIEDAMIAAIARMHSLTVATRNEADFTSLGIVCLNPFKS
jgi:hypothetical protein